jgi:site-specific DNA-methyltransferase (adenine-specific)
VIKILRGDCLEKLQKVKRRFDLVYLDPPFNTGKVQRRSQYWYYDCREDYLKFLRERLIVIWSKIRKTGSMFVHLDYREAHYVKVMLDDLFGRKHFRNEIIWAYDFGGRSKRAWPAKHDTIFWYSKDTNLWTFNREECDRIPYMAPGLCGKEKAAKGKFPTDVFWHTIVPTNSKEKTGYPTQKPVGLLERFVKVHSNEGDRLLDPFAGSGSFGAAALEHGRKCVLIDENKQAIKVMKERFKDVLKKRKNPSRG